MEPAIGGDAVKSFDYHKQREAFWEQIRGRVQGVDFSSSHQCFLNYLGSCVNKMCFPNPV